METSAKERRALYTRRVEAVYRQGETAHESGDFDEAIRNFTRVSELKPVISVHGNASFDYATILIELERWPEAIAVLESFRIDFPDHPLQTSLLEKLVLAYENDRQWDQAAVYLEAIYQREGSSALGRDAL